MLDERMKQQIYKVRNEICCWMYFAVAVSLLVKQLVFGMGIGDCVLEMILIIAVPVYQFIRFYQLEINVDYRKGNKRLAGVLVGTAVCMAVYGILMVRQGQTLHIGEILTYGITFMAAFVGIRLLLIWLIDRHNQKLAKKYDDEEINE